MSQPPRYSRAEPRFDHDLRYGQEAESRIKDLLDWVISDNGRVEVKRKRILDWKIYVETHCDKGRTGEYAPSGINVTTASMWFFVLGATGMHVAVPTCLLRQAVLEASSEDKEERDGSCPTRGKLIDLAVLLYRLKQEEHGADTPRPVAAPVRVSSSSPGVTAAHLTDADIRW